MSGSFNNLMYDANTYATDLRQSTAPLNYRLDPSFSNSCQPCLSNDVGYIGRQGVSIGTQHSLIDTDSNLRLLNYRNSRDPAMKYHPSCESTQQAQTGGCSCSSQGFSCGAHGYPCGGGISPVINQQPNQCQDPKYNYGKCNLYTDYSRLTNPSCNLRGTGVNRFQPMCLNFQDETRWLNPNEVNISYRLVAKDNHRPKIPVPMDQTLALPDPDAKAPNTTPDAENCWGVFLSPMNDYYKDLNTTPYTGKDC
jgi:hypothetical protein